MVLDLRWQVLTDDLAFQYVQQVNRVGSDLRMVEIEHLRQDLERKAGRDTGHSLVDAGIVAILLDRLGLRVRVLEVLAVVHAHLRIDARILGFLESGQDRELCHHLEGAWRTRRVVQRAVTQQLVIDVGLFCDAKAVGHLDDIHTVEECLVVLVVAERLPFRLVGVGEDDPLERDR